MMDYQEALQRTAGTRSRRFSHQHPQISLNRSYLDIILSDA